MLSIYVICMLLSGFFPKKYVDKRVLDAKNIASMKMNWEQTATAFLLAVSLVSALFLLGFYGVKGDVYQNKNQAEVSGSKLQILHCHQPFI